MSAQLGWFRAALLMELDREALYALQDEQAEREEEALLAKYPHLRRKAERDERSRERDHLDADHIVSGGGNFDGAGTGGQD